MKKQIFTVKVTPHKPSNQTPNYASGGGLMAFTSGITPDNTSAFRNTMFI